jgi:hypothetical protein
MSCTDELSAVQHSAPPVVPAREQVKKRQQFLHASVRSHAACLRRFRASPPILRQSALCPRLWASAEAQVSLSPPRISSSPHTLPDESRSASSPRSDKLWGVVRISPRVAAIEEPRGQSAVARARRCRCPACSRISPPTTRSRPFARVWLLHSTNFEFHAGKNVQGPFCFQPPCGAELPRDVIIPVAPAGFSLPIHAPLLCTGRPSRCQAALLHRGPVFDSRWRPEACRGDRWRCSCSVPRGPARRCSCDASRRSATSGLTVSPGVPAGVYQRRHAGQRVDTSGVVCARARV